MNSPYAPVSESPLSSPADRPLNILVVDDELCIRQLLSALLKGEGNFVETALNGLDALDKFGDRHWDVVITDRSMPMMGGEELAEEIKRRSPEVAVVMVTGLLPKMQAGGRPAVSAADVMIGKPFSRPGLRAAIEEALSAVAERATSFVIDGGRVDEEVAVAA